MRPRRSLAFCSESADTYFSGGRGGGQNEKKKKSFSLAPLKNGAAATKHNDGGLFTEGDASEVSMAFPFAAASRCFFFFFLETLKTFSSLLRCNKEDIFRFRLEVADMLRIGIREKSSA